MILKWVILNITDLYRFEDLVRMNKIVFIVSYTLYRSYDGVPLSKFINQVIVW